MGRKSAAADVLIHAPQTREQARRLSQLAAEIHADMVIEYIQRLDCPEWQKPRLLDAVIRAVENK